VALGRKRQSLRMSTLQKRRDQLRDLYGFDWPDDLFRFWHFVRRLKPLDPLNAFYDVLDIVLTGPFDVLDGRFDGRTPRYSPLLHWRYYLDPPEFFTVLVGADFGHHWGYVFDDPSQPQTWVASYYASDSYELDLDGDGLFEAVRMEIEQRTGECHEQLDDDPDDEWAELLFGLGRLRDRLMKCATGDRRETGDDYVLKYKPRLEQSRQRRAVVETADGLGIVVPRRQYRPLKLRDGALRRRLENRKDIDAVVRAAFRAVRDGFPGTALKLGKELWVAGRRYASTSFDLLDAAYQSLRRDVLRAVVREHRAHRDRTWLDVFEEGEADVSTN
jgi:hypothetical protein